MPKPSTTEQQMVEINFYISRLYMMVSMKEFPVCVLYSPAHPYIDCYYWLVVKACPTLLSPHELSRACQVLLSLGFPKQEYGSGLPLSFPGDLLNPGIESMSLSLAGRFFATEPPGEHSYTDSVQFSSVAQSCLTLCDPMNCSTPGLPVHHQLPEFTQTHVHRVSDAVQPSHPVVPFSCPQSLPASQSFPMSQLFA